MSEKCHRGEMSAREKCYIGRKVMGRIVLGRNVVGRNIFWGETSRNHSVHIFFRNVQRSSVVCIERDFLVIGFENAE